MMEVVLGKAGLVVKTTSGKTTRIGCQKQYLEGRLPQKLVLLRDVTKPTAVLLDNGKIHNDLARSSGSGSGSCSKKQDSSLLASILQVLAISEADLDASTDLASLGELEQGLEVA